MTCNRTQSGLGLKSKLLQENDLSLLQPRAQARRSAGQAWIQQSVSRGNSLLTGEKTLVAPTSQNTAMAVLCVGGLHKMMEGCLFARLPAARPVQGGQTFPIKPNQNEQGPLLGSECGVTAWKNNAIT